MLSVKEQFLTLTIPTLANYHLVVTEFKGREALSEPYEFIVTLVADRKISDDWYPWQQDARLQVVDDDNSMKIHGFIGEWHVGSVTADGLPMYQCRIVPALLLLNDDNDSRIYQHKTVQEIVTSLFIENNVRFL